MKTALKIILSVILSFVFSISIHAGEKKNQGNIPGQLSFRMERFEITWRTSSNSFKMNAYVVFSSETREAVLIDPGQVDLRIDDFLRRENLKLVGILNTHGHFDHTGGNQHYSLEFKVPVYVHKGDRSFYGTPLSDQVFFDGKKPLVIGGISIKVIATPGHSRGSVCYLIGNMLFSGDTLFAGSIGIAPSKASKPVKERALREEIFNIKTRLLVLPDNTPVYPGHNQSTTIGTEKTTNRWLLSEPEHSEMEQSEEY